MPTEWSPYPVFCYFLFLLPTVPQDLCTCSFHCPAPASCVKSSHPRFLQVTVTDLLFTEASPHHLGNSATHMHTPTYTYACTQACTHILTHIPCPSHLPHNPMHLSLSNIFRVFAFTGQGPHLIWSLTCPGLGQCLVKKSLGMEGRQEEQQEVGHNVSKMALLQYYNLKTSRIIQVPTSRC